jgi:hypothetical protein
MAATPAQMASRGIGHRTLAALFLALVAAILGAMPGWKMCFAAWLVLSWLVLSGVLLSSAFLAIAAVVGQDHAALRGEGRQIFNVVLLMLAMVPMGLLSTGVEFAQSRTGLRAQADASARAGGPRLAMTPASDADWPMPTAGFVYDVDGALSRPPSRRPAAWNDSPVLMALSGECITVTHFVGHYYRWSSGCDRF